jgi:hypothetical protein
MRTVGYVVAGVYVAAGFLFLVGLLVGAAQAGAVNGLTVLFGVVIAICFGLLGVAVAAPLIGVGAYLGMRSHIALADMAEAEEAVDAE